MIQHLAGASRLGQYNKHYLMDNQQTASRCRDYHVSLSLYKRSLCHRYGSFSSFPPRLQWHLNLTLGATKARLPHRQSVWHRGYHSFCQHPQDWPTLDLIRVRSPFQGGAWPSWPSSGYVFLGFDSGDLHANCHLCNQVVDRIFFCVSLIAIWISALISNGESGFYPLSSISTKIWHFWPTRSITFLYPFAGFPFLSVKSELESVGLQEIQSNQIYWFLVKFVDRR